MNMTSLFPGQCSIFRRRGNGIWENYCCWRILSRSVLSKRLHYVQNWQNCAAL